MLTESTPPEAQRLDVAEVPDPIVDGPLRWLLLGFGFACVGLATLGVFLPLLPTTPFLLLAAACFARSSHRFYRALLGNRIFGPLIRDWRAHRTIPLRAKVLAITAIALVLGSSALFAVEAPAARLGLVTFGVALCAWLWSVPTRRLEMS